LGVRRQVLLHSVLILVPFLVLPISIGGWLPPSDSNPAPWALALLTLRVGLPFFVLSATAPLLQKWFATTGHPLAKDPYFLYAASNLGSMLALLGYPTIIEPFLPLKKDHWISQSWLWTLGYGLLLIVLIFRCAWVVGKSLQREDQPEGGTAEPRLADQSPAPAPLPHLGMLTR